MKISEFKNLRSETKLQFCHLLAGKLKEVLNLSETQFPHLYNGSNNSEHEGQQKGLNLS